MSTTKLIHADCLDALAALDAASVGAVVCDPPSGTGFMNREWDRDKGGRDQWIAWLAEVMAGCHRALKPGGYALVARRSASARSARRCARVASMRRSIGWRARWRRGALRGRRERE